MVIMKLDHQLRTAAEDYKQMFAVFLLNFHLPPVSDICKMGLGFSLGQHGVLPEVQIT